MITKQNDLLGTLVHDVAHLLRHDIDRRLKDYNLTRVKWLALGIVERTPNISQKQLATELELGAASVGRLVDRLEARGFLVRTPALNDRRTNCLHLKPQASTLLAELEEIGKAMRNEALAGLDEQDVKAVNLGLNKIKNNLKGLLSTMSIWIPALLLNVNAGVGEIAELIVVF